MELKQFQMAAVSSLFEAMGKPSRDIVLKSPTGSGKTIILTYFMHQYTQSYPKTVFVWLTPGKGNLEEQSKAKRFCQLLPLPTIAKKLPTTPKPPRQTQVTSADPTRLRITILIPTSKKP